MALFPLGVLTELLINGTWVDISRYVLERDGISINGGSTATGDTAQPSTATLSLKNTDGRFSPQYTGGAYFPYLVRNTQLRISVNDTSSSGNVYNGFRFWGEVPDWPPQSDISGKDIFVQINPTGPLRRIKTGGGEGSALQRYYASLTGLFAPIAYWPCEEDPNAGAIGSGVQGGANMTVVSGSPTFKAVSAFNGSGPIGVINRSTWTGITGAFGSSGDDLFLNSGTYQWVASTTTVNAIVIGAGGAGTKGSEGNGGGPGGSGGEYAQETTLAVTPGQAYTLVVGAGGTPGNWNAGGGAGSQSSFAGDAVTVIANGGGGAGAGGLRSAGGTGSTNTIHHNGGLGGIPQAFNQGAGGGGSGGTSLAGNNGFNTTFGTAGAGGTAVAGGGKGGNGGFSGVDGGLGGEPGGGGGGGWADNSNFSAGGSGAPGSVELIYTGSGGGTAPNNNVMRFILWTPTWGGNDSKVIVRCLTSGSIARMDVQYRTGGNLRLLGYNGSGTQLFDSGNLAVGADGQTLMVSAELAKSGTSVAWAFSAIIPGASGVVAKTNGTVATSSMGSVSEVVVGPNTDISKTAIGHISLQYALVPLWQVSEALNGHDTESGIDRFIRLANEQALGALPQYSEGADHWGFEASTQSWTAANGSLTRSTVTNAAGWPSEGTHSLLLTASGAGSPSATAPIGTSGQPVAVGVADVVSLSIDLFAPVQLPNAYIGLKWYNAAGTFISESDTADRVLLANQPTTFRLVGAAAVAPPTAQYFAPTFGDHHTDAASTLLYGDHVLVAPHMGPQSRKQYQDFLEEIQDLDQGIMKEAKTLWGLAFRTRIKLLNQTPAVTLDYAQKQLTQPLSPIVDMQNVKNDITVHRHKGSKVQVTVQSGAMSILEPPAGTGRSKKTLSVIAAADEQLAALASHLLLLGSSSGERYPTISVNLARCGRPGDSMAPLMSAIAGVEIGDVVQLNNLPFWYPSTTTKQMVIGYTETLNAYEWTITWNCQIYSPYIQVTTNIRRW